MSLKQSQVLECLVEGGKSAPSEQQQLAQYFHQSTLRLSNRLLVFALENIKYSHASVLKNTAKVEMQMR